ncbi:MAG: hypothetical protein JW828_05035 [Sedimentisphaerales bacterium]|nr:hypothetical protein [Sedimentisphaerales bacterium]
MHVLSSQYFHTAARFGTGCAKDLLGLKKRLFPQAIRCIRQDVLGEIAFYKESRPCSAYPRDDLTGDCKVDLLDLAILGRRWHVE